MSVNMWCVCVTLERVVHACGAAYNSCTQLLKIKFLYLRLRFKFFNIQFGEISTQFLYVAIVTKSNVLQLQ